MSDPTNISGVNLTDLKLTLGQAKELLEDTVRRLQEENLSLRMELKGKESFIDALEKTEQYYCKTCGLYGANIAQHEKYCKAELITLKGRTIELEKINTQFNELLHEVSSKVKGVTRYDRAKAIIRSAEAMVSREACHAPVTIKEEKTNVTS